MREWCRPEDFRDRLPSLLAGEVSVFASYLRRIAAEEQVKQPAHLARRLQRPPFKAYHKELFF